MFDILINYLSIYLFTKEVLCYIEVGNIEVTLYWLNPRMDFSHVHVPEAQKKSCKTTAKKCRIFLWNF